MKSVLSKSVLVLSVILVGLLITFAGLWAFHQKSDISASQELREESTEEIEEIMSENNETMPEEVDVNVDVEKIISENQSGFVAVKELIPDLIEEIRYYSDYNFTGVPVDGYEQPVAILSLQAALALKDVADEARSLGYQLKIYDAYRPQRAVDHFVRWEQDYMDQKMKADFYPNLDKSVLFNGYLSSYSGHSRASTVDLTLVDMETGQELDMGTPFDFLDPSSHPYDDSVVSEEQYLNRMLLQQLMINHGFQGLATEWWHFTLLNEPYPSTYFDFTVNEQNAG